jgi:hypothetical protein
MRPGAASMPIRQGGRLASRASTWPRDHFWRSTRAPRRSWPTMWNEFLPISMPITAILLLSVWDMACSFVFGALASLARWQGWSTAGPSHSETWAPLASRSAKLNHCAPFRRSQFLLNPRDARESVSLTRVKHLQLGNAVVGAAEPPTKLAVDILQHHHIPVNVGLVALVKFLGRELVKHGWALSDDGG